jgi:hypothetical protein
MLALIHSLGKENPCMDSREPDVMEDMTSGRGKKRGRGEAER